MLSVPTSYEVERSLRPARRRLSALRGQEGTRGGQAPAREGRGRGSVGVGSGSGSGVRAGAGVGGRVRGLRRRFRAGTGVTAVTGARRVAGDRTGSAGVDGRGGGPDGPATRPVPLATTRRIRLEKSWAEGQKSASTHSRASGPAGDADSAAVQDEAQAERAPLAAGQERRDIALDADGVAGVR